MPENQIRNTPPFVHEEIFKQIEINAELGTFSWNLESGELFYSDNFYRILDCEPGEFTPDIDFFNKHFLHPEDRERIEGVRQNTLNNKESGSWDYRIISKLGHIKHIKALSKVIATSEGNILVGTIQDVTTDVLKIQQIQKRQDELRNKNIELKTSLKVIRNAELSAGLGHWHINLSTNEFQHSDNLLKISGFEGDEITFEAMLNIIHPDDRQNLIENSLKDYQLKRTSISVFRLIQSDGKIRYIKGTSDKMVINKTSYIVGIIHDITNLIDKEIMLEEKNIQLERQNDELASFNHMASHDLQEPLRKIQILTKLILENEDDKISSVSMHYFHRIIQSAERMQNLIEDLLSYSSTNDAKYIKIITSLDGILKEAIHNLKEEIESKNARIEAESLPTCNVIPSQIRQLFINLIDNALKYSKAEVAPIIKISVKVVPGEEFAGIGIKRIAHYYCISFSDNGIGFDPQYTHKIFEIFQRLHGKNEYSGTGIGLTICKKVMQNHNGHIAASGVPNNGAVFSLYFPVENLADIEFI